MRKLLEDKNANLSFFVIFVIISVITIFLFAFASPLLTDYMTHTYNAGQDLLQDAEDQISQIQNEEIKENLQTSLEDAQESTAGQIDLLSNFYKYAWALIIIVTVLVIFVVARSWVEYERRGGVV